MIKQKLITLLTIIGLLFIPGCSATVIKRPAFANEGSVVGERIEKVVERFGPPGDSGGCAISIPLGMDETKSIPGDALFWGLRRDTTRMLLTLCVVSDYVVAEQKVVIVLKGGMIATTSREIIDYKTLAKALEEMLERGDSPNGNTIRRFLHKEDEMEI